MGRGDGGGGQKGCEDPDKRGLKVYGRDDRRALSRISKVVGTQGSQRKRRKKIHNVA